MLTVEKLSRRPEIFRCLTGVDISLFCEICKKIKPLCGNRRSDFEKGGRNHNLPGAENHLLALFLYFGLMFDVDVI